MNQANRPCFLLFQYAQKRKAASAQLMLALCQAFVITIGLPTKMEDILVKRAAECAISENKNVFIHKLKTD